MLTMTPAATIASPFQRFMNSLRELATAERGHAVYDVDDDGNLVHAGTVLTEKQLKGETLEAFHDRVRTKHQVRKGDTLEVLNNGGRLDTIRVTLKPRA